MCSSFNGFDKRWSHAFQVRRSEFDDMLLRNCASKGARVFESVRVISVEFGDLARDQDTLVNVRLEDGSPQVWRTRFLVDASGRDTFLAERLGTKRKNRKHATAAIFGHFRNARRNSGSAEGNITIAWFAHGWFWFIPLKDGTTSVGAVCRPAYRVALATRPRFLSNLALFPEIAPGSPARGSRTATATAITHIIRRMPGRAIYGRRAWAFIAPCFSSGVYLAMKSATLGSDVVDAVIEKSGRRRALS